MAIQDKIPHVYKALPPYQSDLTGFKKGTILLNKFPLSGSDQGINSQWVVNDIDKNGIVVFTPLDSKGENSTRSRPLTGLIPYAVGARHTTKSYFEPQPVHTNATI